MIRWADTSTYTPILEPYDTWTIYHSMDIGSSFYCVPNFPRTKRFLHSLFHDMAKAMGRSRRLYSSVVLCTYDVCGKRRLPVIPFCRLIVWGGLARFVYTHERAACTIVSIRSFLIWKWLHDSGANVTPLSYKKSYKIFLKLIFQQMFFLQHI